MYYLQLSDDPVRFDAVTQLTNVFFDNTNVQVFAVRSGGVTGVTVKGLDPNISTTFRMEDKGSVISIKFSPDHRVLAIQRSHSSVEFMNFKDLAPTTIEYTQNCKWKNASILGFVWSKANEIAFITDHGIELLQVLPERKQLKSLKTVAFSAAWFSHCAQSNIVLLAGNNGAILQPFSLKNSTITKMPKLELEAGRPACERDVTMLRVCGTAWCSLLRHGGAGASIPHPAEISLMPLSASGSNYKHVLKTGLTGRFAVNVVDDLIVVHHQASKTSLLFNIMEDSKADNGAVVHAPIANGKSMKPVTLPDQQCKMYSENWVVFQPNIIIDARLGCLWKVILSPMYLAQAVPPDEIHNIVGVLLRRSAGLAPLYNILNDLISEGGNNLMELSYVFDEINSVYRKWAVMELAKCTGHNANQNADSILKMQMNQQKFPVVINQQDMYTNVLQIHTDSDCIVQVLTAYIASLSRHDITIQHPIAELLATALVRRGQAQRLRQMVRHGCLGDSRPLACLLLSLRNLDPAAGQLALDMLWRLKAYEETVEVLLGCHDPVAAAGTAKQASPRTWNSLSARKLLAAALQEAREKNDPGTFTTIFHALENRNLQTKGGVGFAKSEQCESYIQEYRQLMADYL